MLAILSAFGLWAKSNIKWVAIILTVVATLFVGWWGVSMIKEVEVQRAEIVRLEMEVNYKQLAIDLYKRNAEVLAVVLKDREDEIQVLEGQLDGLTDDLPKDEHELAPDSTQEFFRRLRERLP